MSTPNKVILGTIGVALFAYAFEPTIGLCILAFFGGGYWCGKQKRDVPAATPRRKRFVAVEPETWPRKGQPTGPTELPASNVTADLASALVNLGCSKGKALEAARRAHVGGGSFDEMFKRALKEARSL